MHIGISSELKRKIYDFYFLVFIITNGHFLIFILDHLQKRECIFRVCVLRVFVRVFVRMCCFGFVLFFRKRNPGSLTDL